MTFLPKPPAATVQGGAGVATEKMRADWQAYFSGTVAGTVTPWGGGALTMLPGNQAAMYESSGRIINTRYLLDRQSIDNPNTLQMMCAMYPGIGQAWEEYGVLADTDMKAYFDAELAEQAAAEGK